MIDNEQDPALTEALMIQDERNRTQIPSRYWAANATDPKVTGWADEVLAAFRNRTDRPPSLLITGPTGVGKTYQAFGAIRRITLFAVHHHLRVDFRAASLPDLLALLKPGATLDPEGEFHRWASAPLLLVDDLGVQRETGWTSEILYRLLNHRNAHDLPAIYTSNVPFDSRGTGDDLLTGIADGRIVSRLASCRRMAIHGEDRRPAEGLATWTPPEP